MYPCIRSSARTYPLASTIYITEHPSALGPWASSKRSSRRAAFPARPSVRAPTTLPPPVAGQSGLVAGACARHAQAAALPRPCVYMAPALPLPQPLCPLLRPSVPSSGRNTRARPEWPTSERPYACFPLPTTQLHCDNGAFAAVARASPSVWSDNAYKPVRGCGGAL